MIGQRLRVMASIFVPGGCGFIGANFIRHWLATHPDDKVINYDLLTYAGNPANLADVDSLAAYTFIQGDIADAAAVCTALEEHRPDCIVNFAAESHNSRAVRDPQLFLRTNTMGTQTLLEAARQFKIKRFHQISTCEVFGDLALDSPIAFAEDAPYSPRTPYNASKAAADHVVRAYHHTYGVPVSLSICANNYGPFQFPEKLIPHFVTRLLTGRKMPLYRSSLHRREWLHVADHCRALEVILERGALGQTYNIGAGFEESIEGIADRLLKHFKLPASRKEYVPDRPGHDRRYLLDAAKIKRDLGWRAEIDFADGFGKTVQWYCANETWWQPLLAQDGIDERGWQEAADPARASS